jgi:phosphatidylinositol alpha 1,6-mannosyltransferase
MRGQRTSVRIAFVTDTYTPQVNGVTTVVRHMAQAVTGAGHACTVVAPRYPEGDASQAQELRLPSVPFPPYPAIRLSLMAGRPVARYLDDFRPSVVHVATEGPLGLAGRGYALRRRLPLVTAFHTDFPAYCRHYGAARLEPTVWRWLLWFHRPARLTHTPGEFVRDMLIAKGIRQAVVWGRGVDTDHFRPDRDRAPWRWRLGLPTGTALVLHVGRLAPEKNLAILWESWTIAHAALGARAQFVVAGDGPAAATVRDRMPWAIHLGFLDRDALADLYTAADVCVLPSATETCGLVALEAMASGVPVVAADAGGFRESVRHGVTGFLARTRDPEAFAAHVIQLVMERNRRLTLGAAARRFALSRSAALENAALLAQYRTILDQDFPEGTECAA